MKWKEFVIEYAKAARPWIHDTVTAESHPELHQAMLDVCKELKIPPMDEFHIIQEAFGLPNAMVTHTRQLLVGEKLLETFAYEKGKPVPQELKSIIGHEMGHVINLKRDVMLLHGTAIAAPIAIFAGYKLYEHAKARQEEKGEGSIKQHIELTARQLEHDAHEHTKTENAPAQKPFIQRAAIGTIKNVAEFIAAGIVSIPITKAAGAYVEFGADKTGAKATAPEHMISALEKLDVALKAAMEKSGIPTFAQALMKLGDYHPSMAARIAHLR